MRRSVQCNCFEEHASVLAHWFERSFRERTLVCFDAHLDLQSISKHRLERLFECTTADAISRLMKPHHWYPDYSSESGSDFSYSIEDFLYAAKQLGIIRHLVWVAPPHVPVFDPAAAIEQLQQSDGVDLGALSSLRLVSDPPHAAHWIEGVLYDFPITICREESLSSLQLPPGTLVDIDIDYFVELPSQRIGRSPQATFDGLMGLGLDLDEVTISRSVSSGYTPAQFAWLADALANAFQCGEWTASAANTSIEDFPSEPPGNAGELLRRLSRYSARGIELSRHEFESLMHWSQRFIGAPKCEQPGLVNAGVGLVRLAAGDLLGAKECYRRAAVFGGHPELALEIAKFELEHRELDQAEIYFTKATLDDKSRSFANHYLGVIGVIRFQQFGDSCSLDHAINYLESAEESASAWVDNLSLLSHAYATRGNASASKLCQERVFEIKNACQQFNQQHKQLIHE